MRSRRGSMEALRERSSAVDGGGDRVRFPVIVACSFRRWRKEKGFGDTCVLQLRSQHVCHRVGVWDGIFFLALLFGSGLWT